MIKENSPLKELKEDLLENINNKCENCKFSNNVKTTVEFNDHKHIHLDVTCNLRFIKIENNDAIICRYYIPKNGDII